MSFYRPRLADKILADELEAFGAVLITGPKWCGKTTTASRIAGSVVRMQDPDYRESYETLARLKPSELLKGENPRLIDEWQVAPQLWDAVRLSVDDRHEPGLYILTGSTTVDFSKIKHSGAGRISRMSMGTMTLFESGDATGDISLLSLFNGDSVNGRSDVSLKEMAEIIVRGGWPETIGKDLRVSKRLIRGYCDNIIHVEVRNVDGRRRDPNKMRAVLKSISRNISTPVTKQTIIDDVSVGSGPGISPNTLDDYLAAFRTICLLEEIPAWSPNLRSRTAIRTTPVIQLCDPAVAAHFLSASVADLMQDPNTFGLLFESLVVRDLRVYAQCHGGEVFQYRDRNGLEADVIIHMHDGRWGAIEVKLSHSWVEEGAKNLIKLKDIVDTGKMGKPSFLAVVIPSGYAYTREDGVHVIPITCLRE